MAQILVRQMDEAVVESLKRKAATRGTSLEGYVREVLAREARESRGEIATRLRARLAGQAPAAADSTSMLRALRDGEGEGDLG